MSIKRIAVTGMAVNTPLGDTLDGFLEALLAGRSAITNWKVFDTSNVYSKVGGDLSDYDVAGKLAALESVLEPEMYKRVRRLVNKAPWSTKISLLVSVEAWCDARLGESNIDPMDIGTIVAGHNLNSRYSDQNREEFLGEPDYIEPMFALHSLDTDHAGSVSEALQSKGPIFTVGAACASGNAALRCAVNEVRYNDLEAVVVIGAVLEFAPIDVHAMALMGAISFESFNDRPQLASRPFDVRREGFVPAHGGGALVIENLESAERRGARIYAELLGVEASADANHLPQPSEDGQVAVMRRVLDRCNVPPEDIDYVSAHATSTPLGDVTEIRSVKRVFGAHADKLKVNATKSMIGHTCWAAPTVEAVAAILQMNAGQLHPSINIDEIDAEVDIDVCRNEAVSCDVRYLLKNSFGFGGINCVSLFKRYAE